MAPRLLRRAAAAAAVAVAVMAAAAGGVTATPPPAAVAAAAPAPAAAAAPSAGRQATTTSLPTISGLVAAGDEFTLLTAALKAANLFDTLNDPAASFTVFAPNDGAFLRLATVFGFNGTDEMAALQAVLSALTTLGNGDPVPLLATILKFHVTPGAVGAEALVAARGYTPLEGPRVMLSADNKSLIDAAPAVADPMLLATDIPARNGVVHIISGVLLPLAVDGKPMAPAAPTAKATAMATVTPKATATPMKTAAPMAKATAKATVTPKATATPMKTAAPMAKATAKATTAPKAKTMTIAEVAVATPELSLLVKALTAAGLVDVVADAKASLTVFAPTNKAFLALAVTLGYTGTKADEAFAFVVKALTSLGNGDPVPLLRRILTYHVLPTAKGSAALLGTGAQTTVQGSQLAVTKAAEVVDLAPAVPNGKIVMADVMASNGVVHLVSRVLLPLPICPASAAAFCAKLGAVLHTSSCHCVLPRVKAHGVPRVRHHGRVVRRHGGHGTRVVYVLH